MKTPPVPHNADAERGLIGAAIVDGSITELIDVRPDDFYIQRNGWVWGAVQSMARRGIRPDLVTLSEQLEQDGRLGDVGGAAFLVELVQDSVTSLGAQDYAAIVRGEAERRNILRLAQSMAKAAYNKAEPIDHGEYIDALVASTRPEAGAVHWKHYLTQLWTEIEERKANPEETWGIPTGFPTFDRATGGLQASETVIMSGKPGVGKSMLAVQMCEQMAAHSPGAIYSLEMQGRAVMRRVLSARTRISARALKTGQVNDMAAIQSAIGKLENLPVYMSDATGWDTTSLRADLARLKVKHNIQWFMFDYMLLASDLPGSDEVERTAAISRGMKLTARHLDLAGLVIHSVTKEGMTGVPDMRTLRGSGQISFDADLILFLSDFQRMSDSDDSIPAKDYDNLRTLVFGKGRELEDPRKYIHFVKQPHYPQFGEYTAKENPF